MLPGFIASVRIRCGKANCRCARGDSHIAHYHVTYDRGVRIRKYVRRDQVAEVLAACEAHRELQAQLRAGRAEYKRKLAMIRDLIKSDSQRIREAGMAQGKVLTILALCGTILFFGCGSKTTPKGPIANFDLRSHLPANVIGRAPSDANATEYKAQLDVGEPAAKVQIRWRAFRDGQSAYILSTSFDVLEPANGVELKGTVDAPFNMGTRDAAVAAHIVKVNWNSSSGSGTKSGTIVATGEWRP